MRPRLSVVVANAEKAPERVTACVESLARELGDDEAEVVWVDRSGLVPDAPSARFASVPADPDASRGVLYALGLSSSRAPIVAFTDSTTELLPGWRRAVEEAFERGARIVGGPVLPNPKRTVLSWTGFLFEYGRHAVAPYTSASGDVSGNNIAYAAHVLEDFRGAPFWKSEVNGALAARDIRPAVADGMRVAVHKDYGWRSLFWDRVGHGRQYALWRGASWPAWRRIAQAIGAPLLPPLILARLRSVARAGVVPRGRLAAASPALVGAAVCWAAGEAVGYAAGGTPRKGLL